MSVQPRYHLLERGIERELAPDCRWANVGIRPYSPQAGGFLTAKYQCGCLRRGPRAGEQFLPEAGGVSDGEGEPLGRR